jgi:transcription-repair coupling factor (superfamily II helicase)
MKGESSEERPVTQLNLGIALRIDESYVPEENQRLRLYKKIAGANSEAAVAEVRAEMEDRYGTPPDATVYLLEASLVRLECERMGIAQVDRKRGELQIRFMENAAVDPQHLMRLVARKDEDPYNGSCDWSFYVFPGDCARYKRDLAAAIRESLK